ncbi:MAG: winged helix-turn-helix domain-containing protein [Roseiarcus sp.]|jgi:molybdate transport system regulatory protein
MVAEFPALTLRILLSPDTAVGLGKANLLQYIEESGSIAAASRQMGMSYKRAWYLIDTMNAYFREPVVTATKGGKSGGGAHLTPTGRAVLDAYRRMEAEVARVTAPELEALAALAARTVNTMT